MSWSSEPFADAWLPLLLCVRAVVLEWPFGFCAESPTAESAARRILSIW